MKESTKAQIKKYLFNISILLFIVWVVILLYGIFVERNVNLNLAESHGQIQKIDITSPMDKGYEIEKLKKEELEKGLDDLIKETNDPNSFMEKDTASQIKEKTDDFKSEVSSNLDTASLKKNPKKALPKIAILVANLGTNKHLTEEALKLDENITLGFSSYTKDLKNLFQTSISSNREVLIYLPFEPKDYPKSNPGPHPILIQNDSETNLAIINSIIETFDGIIGVYGNEKEVFTESKALFLQLANLISSKNLIMFLNKENPDVFFKLDIPRANIIFSDSVIDIIPNADSIIKNLNHLIEIAKERGYAVGYANSYPITLRVLSDWCKTLSKNDVELVQISRINN
ncbi:MAG: divergent polysaccharide deacetylase family protein [Rickettsiaceae bacterium]|nr:divergent polysaccharide deacetylase family protein [Rickettsiaceae bacterium]